MGVTIELPDDAGVVLRNAFGEDLSRPALEAMAAEGYRTGKLTLYEVQKMLGHPDRWATEVFLGSRGVNRNYDAGDLEADRESLRRVLGPARP